MGDLLRPTTDEKKEKNGLHLLLDHGLQQQYI
jgi:hypothetical protein